MAAREEATDQSETPTGDEYRKPNGYGACDTSNDIRPYGAFWHPDKTLIDIILSFLMTLFLPLRSLENHPALCEDEGTAQELQNLRVKLIAIEKPAKKSKLTLWSKRIEEPIAECRIQVSRQHFILCKWNIVDKNDVHLKEIENGAEEEEEFVAVLVRGPKSVLCPDAKMDELETNESGCVALASIDWTTISNHIPILLWFHGGGLIMGQADDSPSPTNIDSLVARQLDQTGGEAPLVVASVEYRLAPEHPFPAALIDALSVAAFFLEMSPDRRLHLGGISAGGYLTTLTAFACHRAKQGRIQSAFIQSPMVSPSCDSISYQQNATSSGTCPAEFARWCWRAALQLEVVQDDDVPNLDVPSTHTGASLREAWQASKWWKSEIWRKIIEPTEGIPSSLDDPSAAKYIVAVNKADPLHDEGLQLAERLQAAGANTTFIDSGGTHVLGFEFDKSAQAEMMEAWRSAIWD